MSSRRYFFDARHLDASGIGSYTADVLRALTAAREFDGSEWTIAVHPSAVRRLSLQLPTVKFLSSRAGMYGPAEQLLFAHPAITKAESVFLPHYPVPVRPVDGRLVVTVHDVLHALPEKLGGPSPLRRTYAHAMFSLLARRADQILTVSEFTAEQLIQIQPSLRGRVTVISHGIDEWWFDPLTQATPDLPSSKPFFIYVGNVKPHKNLQRLIEAIAGVPEGVDLYIVGGNAVAKNFDVVALRAIERSDRVFLLGRVGRDDLKYYLSKALALVMPSLYEGLGLPPLEAMAVGTPVAVSSIPALQETCAQAAVYFDPRDVGDIRRVLNDLLTQPTLRDELRRLGKARARARTSRSSAQVVVASIFQS